MLQLHLMTRERTGLPAPAVRVAISIGVPLLGAILLSAVVGIIVGRQMIEPGERAGTALLLGWVGALSFLLGARWYGPAGLGLRGGRPLYASIGFAVLGWVTFLLLRLVLLQSSTEQVVATQSGRAFFYLLVFEALCLQLWLFGLVFRSLADWRGPLTAALTSGVLFAMVAVQFFQESYISGPQAFLFFLAWGVFYGLIRLRTGSFIGTVIIQAMQSLTSWYILLPQSPPDISQLRNLYLAAGIVFAFFIWRLWPAEEGDYRV